MKNLLVIILITLVQQANAGRFQRFIDNTLNNNNYYNRVIDTTKKEIFKTGYKGIFKLAYDQKDLPDNEKEYPGFLPNQLFDIYFKSVQTLFLAGYLDSAGLDYWVIEYKRLYLLTAPDVTTEKTFWEEKHNGVLGLLMTRLGNGDIGCASDGDIVNNKKCCINHLKINTVVESLPNRACNKSQIACSNNNECCSGQCFKEGASASGSCLPQVSCKYINSIGDQCNIDNNICDNSECIKTGSIMKCVSCKDQGASVGTSESCCPGLIKLGGKCSTPMPVFIPSVFNRKSNKNLIEKIFNIIFPAAHAAPPAPAQTEAQSQFLDQKRATCAEENQPGSDALRDCLAEVTRLEEQYQKDLYLALTNTQEQQVSAKREECTQNHTTNTDDHKDCMAEADVLKKEFLEANKTAGAACEASHAVGSEPYRECMLQVGLMGAADSSENYINRYQVPSITAKTFSDIKKCEFNSFNDSWRDASNKEKNAEVFLRAYEYVFSHKGTNDTWEDPSKGNIFKRANEAAKTFRINRGLMLEEMKKTDKTMACKCIAIFGPSNFDSAKIEFFNASCEEEKAALQVTLGEDLGKDAGPSKIDGTSISTLEDDVGQAEGAAEEIDKAAIGISHEKLLMEWLQLRAAAQMNRFVDNSDLEEGLSELSEFIANVDFDEVYKDRVENNAFVQSDPRGNGILMYKWGHTYHPGGLLGNLAWGDGSQGVLGAMGDEVTYLARTAGSTAPTGFEEDIGSNNGLRAAWRYSTIDELNSVPEVQDVKTLDKKCIRRFLGACTKYLDGYDRYFVGPRFNNNSTNDAYKCSHTEVNKGVRGRASACFKSAYRVDFNGSLRYIVDPTLPLFVSPTKVALNVMPGYNQSYIELINEASERGERFLKNKKPNGAIKRGYSLTSDHFGSEDHMQEAIDAKHFLPAGNVGGLKEISFENNKIHIINGAVQYAMCKSLKDCGATSLDPELNGFGYLFESRVEATSFGQYAYDIHYKWSHMSKEDYMGYPLDGMDQYFKLASYNMKLVGSLASARSLKYAEAYEKYKADWDKRVNEYDSLGKAAMGTHSRNVQYSPAFYALFKMLSLDGATNIPSFDASMNQTGTNAVSFSKAEIKALNAGRASALRRNSDIKKSNEFKKAMVSAGADTKNSALANTKRMSLINSPLASFGMSKFGGKSLRNLTAAINNMNKSIKGINKGENKNNFSGYNSTFTMPKRVNFNSSVGSPGAAPRTPYNDQGMDKGQISALLKNLKKSRKLNPLENDNIFTIVSKAYKRNYSKVLRRSRPKTILDKPKEKSALTDKNKTNLKNLLESN